MSWWQHNRQWWQFSRCCGAHRMAHHVSVILQQFFFFLCPNAIFPDPLPPVLLQDFSWEAEGGFGKGGTSSEWQVHRILDKLMRQGGSLAHRGCYTGQTQLWSKVWAVSAEGKRCLKKVWIRGRRYGVSWRERDEGSGSNNKMNLEAWAARGWVERALEARADQVYLFLSLAGFLGVVLKSCETGGEGIGVVGMRDSLGKWQKCGWYPGFSLS